MNFFAEAMSFLSAAGIALFVGALLTEAMVLVPMWRTLQPQEFFSLHAAHAHRLYTFLRPSLRARRFLRLVLQSHPSRQIGHKVLHRLSLPFSH